MADKQYQKELKKRIGPSSPLPTETARKWKTVEDILEKNVAWSKHSLTIHQLNKVRAGKDYVSSPYRRIVSTKSAAKTLVGSYKKGYLCNGEFLLPPGNRVPTPILPASIEDRNEENKYTAEKLPRFFTPRECARLQGFPEDFKIDLCANPNRFYFMIGNSVCPLVISAIALSMFRASKQ